MNLDTQTAHEYDADGKLKTPTLEEVKKHIDFLIAEGVRNNGEMPCDGIVNLGEMNPHDGLKLIDWDDAVEYWKETIDDNGLARQGLDVYGYSSKRTGDPARRHEFTAWSLTLVGTPIR